MSEPWIPPGPKVPPRDAQVPDVLWRLQRGRDVYRAELRYHEGLGYEFQVYLNEEFVYGRHHESRWMAENEAGAFLELNESQGWKIVTSE
jgi:hypothetical protein